MDEKDWPLTSRAIEESERAAQGDYDLTDDGPEPEQGMSVLHELALEGVVEERAPGRYYISKLRPDRDKLS